MSDLKITYRAFVAKLFNRTGDLSKDFAHAVLGILTEIDELSLAREEINILEEKGDLTFFHEALRIVIQDALGVTKLDDAELGVASLPILLQSMQGTPQAALQTLVIELLDATKRWVGYGKAPEDYVKLFAMATLARVIAEQLLPGQDLAEDDVMQGNMRKLSKRYKGGEFNSADAIVRDLEAERAALANT